MVESSNSDLDGNAFSTVDQPLRSGSPDRFSFQWARYTSYKPIHLQQFLEWTSSLPREEWIDRDVLDVGCGMGRNSLSALEAGARSVTAVDVDPTTISVAESNLRDQPRAHVRSGSAYEEGDGEYDIVMCIGVLHHLGDQGLALRSLLSHVRPGGSLVLWVYGSQGLGRLHRLIDVARFFTSRIDERIVWAASLPLARLVRSFIRLRRRPSPYERRFMAFDLEDARVVLFDQLIPRIATYFSESELREFLLTNRVVEATITEVNGASWSVRIPRPSVDDWVPSPNQDGHSDGWSE